MISVVVPIYNVERYLPRCIDSLLSQSYADFELLLIDDGSKDGGGRICDDYAERDPRVRVFHLPNGGVSSARNFGIDNACGEWVAFVDSDDWVERGYLEGFCHQEHCADLYISGASYDLDGEPYSCRSYRDSFVEGAEAIVEGYNSQGLWSNGYPWGKLFRRDIIERAGLRFDEDIRLHEDHIFIFNYLSLVRSLSIIDGVSYHYTMFDPTGRKLSNVTNSYEMLLCASDGFRVSLQRLRSRFPIGEDLSAKLQQRFVCGTRFEALRSLLLQHREGRYREYCREVEWWRRGSTDGATPEQMVACWIMVRLPWRRLSYILLCSLFRFKRFVSRDMQRSIKRYLNSRSVRL